MLCRACRRIRWARHSSTNCAPLTARSSTAAPTARRRARWVDGGRGEPKMPDGENRHARTTIEDVEGAPDAVSDGGRPAAVARQHALGKLTARERIEQLLAPGSFVETGALVTPDAREGGAPPHAPADGVVAGLGLIDDRPVTVYATDFTVFGGSLGDVGMRK